jgi:hypothetical protein
MWIGTVNNFKFCTYCVLGSVYSHSSPLKTFHFTDEETKALRGKKCI